MAITIDGTNGLSSDNAALKLDGTTLTVDETNNRVGVGTASPAVAMDVVGQVRASTGILFGSDTAAANALDDYEEGTFTPTLAQGVSTAPTSYDIQNGRYTKIGRFVYFEIDLDPAGAIGSGSQIKFGGLPFTSVAAPYGGAFVIYNNAFNTNAGDNYLVAPSNTVIEVHINDGTGRAGNSAGISINNRIIFAGIYTAA